jgi:hypothetical protein
MSGAAINPCGSPHPQQTSRSNAASSLRDSEASPLPSMSIVTTQARSLDHKAERRLVAISARISTPGQWSGEMVESRRPAACGVNRFVGRRPASEPPHGDGCRHVRTPSNRSLVRRHGLPSRKRRPCRGEARYLHHSRVSFAGGPSAWATFGRPRQQAPSAGAHRGARALPRRQD